MRAGSFALGKGIGLGYERTATLALTAAGNNIAELLPGWTRPRPRLPEPGPHPAPTAYGDC
jgi:hypothetical protein